MRIISWNVQGLGGPNYARYRGRLRQELMRCLIGGPVDFLMLQEHHLTESRTRRCGQLMPRHSEVFWSGSFGPSGTQGGICMSIADTWRDAILDRGIVVPGRAQWILLQWGEIRLGLLNLYAPNHASARTVFWTQITDALPSADEWCIGGDFNMIEAPEDRCGGGHVTVHGSELAAWERLCLSLRISDVWHSVGFSRESGSLHFSRSDRRIGSTNLSRLDRMYASDLILDRGGSVGILGGTCMSDHSPVMLVVDEGTRQCSQSLRIPESVQLDEKLADKVEQHWRQAQLSSESHVQALVLGLGQICTLFREEAAARLAQTREAERRLHRSIASLQRLLESSPDSDWIGTQLAQAQQELRETEERRYAFLFHRQAAQWTQVGDRVSGEFFSITGPRHSRSGIRRLRRTDGSLSTEPAEMREIATEFYSELLSEEALSPTCQGNRQEVLRHVRRSVTDAMRGRLSAPFSCCELAEATRALARDSCPGVDGLLPSFFLCYWDLLGEGLRLAFQEMMDVGLMPETLSEGLIFLIPKEGGDSEMIRQWRPITILNSAYKILAKALSLRLQPMLDSLIHPTQTGFVKERSILDNIFTFWEAVSLARLRGEPLAVLLLDFEKAYDRVDWAFLEAVMRQMGFLDAWIRGVASLYRSAHSQVLMAGGRGERFSLSRSVRQGCPLAPTLFLFFAEAMSSFLAAHDTGLQGLRLPVREEELLDAEFADDTAAYLHGHEANLIRFQTALEQFCDASGARINWHKSYGFWVGEVDRPQWSPSAQFQWVPPGRAVRYLGCQVGLDLTAEQQIAPLLLSIRKKLLHWSSARLSLAGRVVVANQVLLATMWYITSCWVFSSSCISQVQRLIRNFLWSGRDGGPARAKVAWPVITLPTALGGLGIVDPACQSRALLGKLIVRGLLPGAEPWKELLVQRLGSCTPDAGGPWQIGIRWIFTEMHRVGFSRRTEDRFARSLLKTWEQLRHALIQTSPSCVEEIQRQPLVWNPQVRSARGHMVGSRKHVSWGALAAGPARCVGEWLHFRQLPEERQRLGLTGMRGAEHMVRDIEDALPVAWLQQRAPAPIAWMGAFTRFEVLIAVRGCTEQTTLFFELGEGGRLHRVCIEATLVAECVFQRVRIVGKCDRTWHIDP